MWRSWNSSPSCQIPWSRIIFWKILQPFFFHEGFAVKRTEKTHIVFRNIVYFERCSNYIIQLLKISFFFPLHFGFLEPVLTGKLPNRKIIEKDSEPERLCSTGSPVWPQGGWSWFQSKALYVWGGFYLILRHWGYKSIIRFSGIKRL